MNEKINQDLICIVLAAGKGARMKSAVPKPLHRVAGKTMLHHVLDIVSSLHPTKIIVVVGPDMPAMNVAAQPHVIVTQDLPDGTGGAVRAACDHLQNIQGDVLVVYGDSPLVTAETLNHMRILRHSQPKIGLVYAGVSLNTDNRYGRMIIDANEDLQEIVEFKDANAEQKTIHLCNGGFLCADAEHFLKWLEGLKNDNSSQEFYLTGLPPLARCDEYKARVLEIPAEEMEGANDRQELARLERFMQDRLRRRHMMNGVTLTDPDTVFFSADTMIGPDTVIGPHVIFGAGVELDSNVEILPFSHLEGVKVASGARIGPFARVRPGTVIGARVKVGNFVEVKNAQLAAGAKVNHLSYIGDAEMRENVNIGAGVITCNYDGFQKHKTVIERGAFIGSNVALVAPLTVGEGALIGAGSTLTEDVPAGALALARARASIIGGWATAFKEKMKKRLERK